MPPAGPPLLFRHLLFYGMHGTAVVRLWYGYGMAMARLWHDNLAVSVPLWYDNADVHFPGLRSVGRGGKISNFLGQRTISGWSPRLPGSGCGSLTIIGILILASFMEHTQHPEVTSWQLLCRFLQLCQVLKTCPMSCQWQNKDIISQLFTCNCA